MLSSHSNPSGEAFAALVRLGIGHSATFLPKRINWQEVKALTDKHGLLAVVLDGIDRLPEELRPPQIELLQWIGEVLQNYEQRYEQYKDAISSLAEFYDRHGFKMMVLKGYACSLDWPKPSHRPCGDIDIWQFGKQKWADVSLFDNIGIEVDYSHHHHTVFYWEDFMVENHYDFLNVHHHKSNVELEAILKSLASSPEKAGSIEMHIERQLPDGEKKDGTTTVYLPSANLHALFLLRHSMSNFASTGMLLRQLLDWAFFVEKHGKDVDWSWLEEQLNKFGMTPLYNIFNAICVDNFGFECSAFGQIEFEPHLKERVFNDIITPEFSEKEEGGLMSRAIFKYRRWKANGWKHKLCFNDSMWSAFWSGVKSHLIKPASI